MSTETDVNIGVDIGVQVDSPVVPVHDAPLAPVHQQPDLHRQQEIQPDYSNGDLATYHVGKKSNFQPNLFFGQPLPANATAQDAEKMLTQMAGIFYSDMAQLSHNSKFIDAAISWFRTTAFAMPTSMPPVRHGFNLFGEKFDPAANSFGNAMAAVGANQEFVTSALWWLDEFAKRMQSQTPQTHAQAEDARWKRIEQAAVVDRAKAEQELRQRWAWEYEQRMAVLQRYFDNLPERERFALEEGFTTDGTALLNSPDYLERLYRKALNIDATKLGGGNLQAEISAIETVMRVDRGRYNRDEALQQRYRELLTLRDGR
ncbi:hypothetical protein [Pseudomonas indica]|uniref:hypothetical protein n=1 Tax=Pseudomonas indica TaxID=137658 RepID=UPI0023F88119|nr:hypothetical protein [Pseudomonas indica]MBU3055849.1 hypothetical protein [Pseudomonas indica]